MSGAANTLGAYTSQHKTSQANFKLMEALVAHFSYAFQHFIFSVGYLRSMSNVVSSFILFIFGSIPATLSISEEKENVE